MKVIKIYNTEPTINNCSMNTLNEANSLGMKNKVFLLKNSIEEVIGRSMVNFYGKNYSAINKLSVQDSKFTEIIGKLFRLNDDDVNWLKDFTKEFLGRYNAKTLSFFRSDDIFEYANELSWYSEMISKKFNLSDFESIDLDSIIDMHINIGDIAKYRDRSGKTIVQAKKYVKDFTPFNYVMDKYGVESEYIYKIFDEISSIAYNYGQGTIFGLFSKDNINVGSKILKKLIKKYCSDKSDAVTDMLIDFYRMSGKSAEELVSGINTHFIEESFVHGLNSLIIAAELSKRYNIGMTNKLINILDSRANITQMGTQRKSLNEIAFRIADEFDLPSGAEKEIISIIEDISKNADSTDIITGLSAEVKY